MVADVPEFEPSPILSPDGTLWLARIGSQFENVFVPNELERLIARRYVQRWFEERRSDLPRGGPSHANQP